ncbi:MAG: methyltransferase domain-containing protein [Terriglobales bacterium]
MPYLVCPQCHGGLELQVLAEQAGEVIEGRLPCGPCRRTYEVRGGVPRLLPLELSQEKQATASAFGYEWTHFTELTQQYRQEFLDWIKPVGAEFFAGKVVLDAGCGKGRHAYLSASFGARAVMAVDLSDAVEAAYHNTRHLPNVHVLQADIYALPFLQPFDYAYSIGVIHHLPDPRQGFFSVLRHVKPGGRVSVWVYGKEGNGWIVKLVDPVRIHLTSRAPRLVTRALSLALAVPLYLALKLVYGPVNRSTALRSLRKLLFYNDYLAAISDFSFAENYWNVFDHLVAPTAFYLSRDQVAEWFQATGLQSVEITPRNNNSWRGTAVMPTKARPPKADPGNGKSWREG